ncbi:MAG: hypothetical protein QOD24_2651 [Solirubrobacteraceae bacterium]|nr:hypothetical protein [Solirubrobacteraceae bacterium]
MSDHPLEDAVMTALAHNVYVNADEIVVEVIDGRATLGGTVGTLVERAEAVQTARKVPGIDSPEHRQAAVAAAENAPGVASVHSELRVRARPS